MPISPPSAMYQTFPAVCSPPLAPAPALAPEPAPAAAGFDELAGEIRRLGRLVELNHAVAKDDSDLDEDDQRSLGKIRKADIPTENGINCIA